ncbi:hypothetical protein J14TS5_49540 [Paenibacillus lautus]|nr:hypothetical protein J14TS5_49540 [Paenibacillus lautus]
MSNLYTAYGFLDLGFDSLHQREPTRSVSEFNMPCVHGEQLKCIPSEWACPTPFFMGRDYNPW